MRRYPCRNSMSPSLEPYLELWLSHTRCLRVWNSVKQLAAIWGLYAATFVLDATASLACLFAATASPVAFGGLALLGPCPVVPVAVVISMFRWALRCCQLRCWLRLRSCAWGSARRPLVCRKILRVQSLLTLMRLLCLLRPHLWFLTMLRLLGLLPWYLVFLQLPSLCFQLSLLFESKPAFR